MPAEAERTPALEAAYEGALVLRAPELGTLRVRGGDRATWLNGLVTCDVKKLQRGTALHGMCVSKTGKIQADLVLLATSDSLLVGLPGSQRELVQADLEHHLIMEDAELSDATDEVSWLFVHGPRAFDVSRKAASGTAEMALLDGTGLGGCVLALPRSEEASLLRVLASMSGVVVGDEADREDLRCDRFVPRFGVDFDPKNYPHEASLDRVGVAFDKGCYLGQEAVCMIEMRGQVKKKLVQLAVPFEAKVGDVLSSTDGSEVGALTSLGRSGAGAARQAIGWVKQAHACSGAELLVPSGSVKVQRILPGSVAG